MSVSNTSLVDLHVDCLEPIIALLPAYSIGNLWLIGEARLQKLLSEGGGVRRFHYSFETTYPLLWPHLMNCFPRLIDVSIEVSVESEYQTNFAPNILALPPNVEHLKLNFRKDFSTFQRTYEAIPKLFSKLKSLQIVYETNKTAVDLDLSLLAGLTQLRLNNNRLENLLINTLVFPPHLTDLQVSLTESGLESMLSSLPQTVTDLSITVPSYGSIWYRLPRNLLHLYIAYGESVTGFFGRSGPRELATDLDGLPPNLQTLSVHLEGFNEKMANSLPKSIKELSVDLPWPLSEAGLKKIYPLLPQTLEGLYSSLRPDKCSTELAKLFPRHLKSLVKNPEIGAMEHLPQSTKTMRTTSCEDYPHLARFSNLTELACSTFDESCMIHLPRTLVRLDIDYSGSDLTLMHVQQLPPALTTLNLRYTTLAPSLWHALPRGLTTFVFESHNEPHRVQPEDALNLPRSLTALNLQYLEACKTFFANLPTSITKMEISVSCDVEWALALPRFKNMQHLMINVKGLQIANAKLILQHLPRRLKIFELFICSSTDLQPRDLLLCPPGLQRIRIPSFTESSHELSTLQGLPPFLDLQSN